MNALLEPILRSHQMPKLVRELCDAAQAEAQRRAKFREELTPEMKAEFIDGEVIMHSPARAVHLDITANLFMMLRLVSIRRALGKVYVEKCFVALTRNDYEPDVAVYGAEKAAGIRDEQMEFPAPDLIVEVLSDSTAARDRGVKFADYAFHGVGEYWIVDPDAHAVEQYLLPPGAQAYQLHERLTHGTLRSKQLGGLDIPLDAIFESAACSAFTTQFAA